MKTKLLSAVLAAAMLMTFCNMTFVMAAETTQEAVQFVAEDTDSESEAPAEQTEEPADAAEDTGESSSDLTDGEASTADGEASESEPATEDEAVLPDESEVPAGDLPAAALISAFSTDPYVVTTSDGTAIGNFTTLLAAVNACTSASIAYIITISEDTTDTSAILIAANRNITLISEDPEAPVTLTQTATNVRHFTVSGSLTLQNITLDGSRVGGGITVNAVSGASLTMEDGATIQNCYRSSSGAAVYNYRTLTMNGGSICGNQVTGSSISSGGGVYNDTGTFIMNGGEISNNMAFVELRQSFAYGGGVYNYNGTFTMNGGKISGNEAITSSANYRAQNYGGGVYNTGTFTMVRGEISGNVLRNVLTTSTNPVFPNNSVSHGGGVYNTGTFTMEREALIADNKCDGEANVDPTAGDGTSTSCYNYGGGVYNNDGVFTMNGGTIRGNSCRDSIEGYGSLTSFGGGVYNYGKFTMNDGATIEGCSAVSGGGVHHAVPLSVNYGFTMHDGALIQSCTATTGGGLTAGGLVEMYDGARILDCSATTGGGVYFMAVYTYHNFYLYGGTISGNTADRGGGVYASSSGQNGAFYMQGGEITGNYSTGTGDYTGAGVYSNIATFNMSAGAITGNEALDGGGSGVAVYTKFAYGVFNMTGGEISANTAAAGGGGVSVGYGSFNLQGDSKIDGNKAQSGGGIYVCGYGYGNLANFNMTGGEIRDNHAALYGGGAFVSIYGTSSTGVLNLSDGAIQENTADTGGGVYVLYGTLNIDGGSISDNVANQDAGGLWVGGSVQFNLVISYGVATMTAGEVSENEAGGNGGGAYIAGDGTLTIDGGAVSGNTAVTGNGGGIYVSYGSGTNNARLAMTEGTIDNNDAPMGNGGGIYTQEHVDYANLELGAAVEFIGNHASAWYSVPQDAATRFPNIATFSASILDHPLNNYDINSALYTVTYDANGGSGTVLDTTEYNPGALASVLAHNSTNDGGTGMTNSGYQFTAWNTDPDGDGASYLAGDAITMDRNVVLYAQWEEEEEAPSPSVLYYTVTYDGNGHSSGSPPVDSGRYADGDAVTVLGNTGSMTKSGYRFSGWSLSTSGGTVLSPGDQFTMANADVTFYARWSVVSSGGSSGGGTGTSETATEEIAEPEVPLAPSLTTDHIWYIQGYPDESVRPDANLTRAEAAAIFYRLIVDSSKTAATDIAAFADVAPSAWYEHEVSYLAAHGILLGYEDGTFRGDNPISRAEFAAIASRFSALTPTDSNLFGDVPDNHWAVAYINSAAAKGWVSGYPDGTFRPDQNIVRGEAATLVNHVLDRALVAQNEPEGLHTYTDLTPAHWAYYEIMEASHTHDYDLNEAGEEIWTTFAYAQD
ncbi:MAG: S-layer homology domain-containing protein [Oscillospiraceae bacterium]|nr:S-layer homology domain-containing protein [Oscillospiraceae bacterium]